MSENDRINATQPGEDPIVTILDEMLQSDETITARAVARKHPTIRHASSITRQPGRVDLLAKYQAQQAEYRSWQGRLKKTSRQAASNALAQKDQRIAELERQVESMRVAVLAMIRSVGELGGMSRWLGFFEGYREIRDELKKLGLIPATEVKEMGASRKR